MTKYRLIAAVVVIIVIIFTYSVVNIYRDIDKAEIEHMEQINAEAKKAAAIAKTESDSTKARSAELKWQVAGLQGELKQHTVILGKIQTNYDQSINILKQIKNEKTYVPDDASPNEQSDFLSGFKYEPY